jgi:TFIIF-interacting CTD phosphatase-like protein
MNIILDMDETLITHKFNPHGIFSEPVPRPHLKEFFEFIFTNCKNVSIWTHGLKEWYDIVYEKILKDCIPEGKSFHFVRTREAPIIESYNDIIEINQKLHNLKVDIPSILFLKPLLLIYKKYPNEYNENNTFIIDDKEITYCLNEENAIEIQPYNIDNIDNIDNSDNSDTELLRIIDLIKEKYLI